jgi:LysR family glycine cleavage system transcriptional activator
LHELVEGKVDLLIAPEGTADCPEVVSFREWLRALPAENARANRRGPRLVGIIGS